MTDAPPPPLSVPDLLASAPTGSLVFHVGTDPKSRLVRVAEASDWSHVGIVVRPSDLGSDDDGVWLWEDTALDTLPDELRGTRASGSQIVDLEDRLRGGVASGQVSRQAARMLRGDLGPQALAALAATVRDESGAPFPGLARLAVGYALHLFDAPSDRSDMVCAVLAAKTLRAMGVLGGGTPPNGYGLRDFEPGGQAERDLRPGFAWGPLVDVEPSD